MILEQLCILFKNLYPQTSNLPAQSSGNSLPKQIVESNLQRNTEVTVPESHMSECRPRAGEYSLCSAILHGGTYQVALHMLC